MSEQIIPSSSIPQADPRAGYRAHHAEIDAALARMLEGGRYILGPEVDAFEREFAAYIGTRHGIGAASGTEALVLALKALDLGPDDYVATVSHTAVATVAAIELAETAADRHRSCDLHDRSRKTRSGAGEAAGPCCRRDSGASLWPWRGYERDRRARAAAWLAHH
jgi:hypothetical protein